MFLPRQRSKNKSMDARNNTGSFKIGVMSLKAMPFFGKSDTSRTAARSFSTIPEAIGANASGLEQNVNHRPFRTLRAGLRPFLPSLFSFQSSHPESLISIKLPPIITLATKVSDIVPELPTGNGNLK